MIGTNVFIHFNALKSDSTATIIHPDCPVKIKLFKPYESYPLIHIHDDRYQCYFEGHCFAPAAAIKLWVNDLFDALVDQNKKQLETIVSRFWKAGGEYACWIFNSQQMFFFNDALGRLPVYEWRSANQYFIGRSLGSLFSEIEKQPDLLGLAQYVWAGYSIGGRTMYAQVSYVTPGTIQYIDLATTQVHWSVRTTYNFSFRNVFPVTENAQLLKKLFLAGCKRMMDSCQADWHLSLSGGQDSRAVLASMHSLNMPVTSSSFRLPGSFKDAAIAQQVAQLAGVSWQRFDISESIDDSDWIIQLKQGLNYSGMAFIAAYLSQVAAQMPNAILLTGDGGDVALPYFGEFRNPGSVDHLVSLLLKRHAITPAAEAAALFGIHTHEMAQSLHQLVSSYPEEKMNDRSIHFAVFERIGKAYFEGEDRNRYFIWSTTPFYDPAFFKAAMEVPDKQKRNYQLYYQFMKALAPSFNQLPDAGGGHIGTVYFQSRKFVRENFRSSSRPVKMALKKMNALFSNEAGRSKQSALPLPVRIGAIDENAWLTLLQKQGYQTYLHLHTISKVFS